MATSVTQVHHATFVHMLSFVVWIEDETTFFRLTLKYAFHCLLTNKWSYFNGKPHKHFLVSIDLEGRDSCLGSTVSCLYWHHLNPTTIICFISLSLAHSCATIFMIFQKSNSWHLWHFSVSHIRFYMHLWSLFLKSEMWLYTDKNTRTLQHWG